MLSFGFEPGAAVRQVQTDLLSYGTFFRRYRKLSTHFMTILVILSKKYQQQLLYSITGKIRLHLNEVYLGTHVLDCESLMSLHVSLFISKINYSTCSLTIFVISSLKEREKTRTQRYGRTRQKEKDVESNGKTFKITVANKVDYER